MMACSPVILHVAPIGVNGVSGFALSVPGLISALNRCGAHSGLIDTHPEACSIPQEFPVFHYQNWWSRFVYDALPQPFNTPNLIVFHSTYIPTHARLASQAYHNKIPYIVTPRGGLTREAQEMKRLKKIVGNVLFFKQMVRRSIAIHCLTYNEAISSVSWGRPVFVIGNGVPIPNSDFLKLGGCQNVRFVFIGRLDIAHKGLDLLLDACNLAQFSLREHSSKILIYGPDRNGSMLKLEKIIQRYSIQDVVELKGAVFADEKREVLRNADVFVHTSRFEGHPMAVLEALSYGVPCLLTPGTNMADEVAIAGAGWRVAPDPVSIALTIKKLLENPVGVTSKRGPARKLIEKSYSWESIGQQTLEHYSRILATAHLSH